MFAFFPVFFCTESAFEAHSLQLSSKESVMQCFKEQLGISARGLYFPNMMEQKCLYHYNPNMKGHHLESASKTATELSLKSTPLWSIPTISSLPLRGRIPKSWRDPSQAFHSLSVLLDTEPAQSACNLCPNIPEWSTWRTRQDGSMDFIFINLSQVLVLLLEKTILAINFSPCLDILCSA